MKINWKQKLSSRKFWCAVAGFATSILAAFNIGDMTASQITAVISAVGVLAVYIFGESMVDMKKTDSDSEKKE